MKQEKKECGCWRLIKMKNEDEKIIFFLPRLLKTNMKFTFKNNQKIPSKKNLLLLMELILFIDDNNYRKLIIDTRTKLQLILEVHNIGHKSYYEEY